MIDIDKSGAKSLGGGIEFVCGDIGDAAFLDDFARGLDSPVDIVVNNACISRRGLLSGCGYSDFLYVLQVGLVAPYYIVNSLRNSGKLALGAAICNIASTRANQSQPDTESYSAAKGGLLALTHAMAASLAGVARVNAISPGWIENDPAAVHTAADSAQHPAGRIGKPRDIAEMALFLCDNNKAGFITGQNFVIDGGMSGLMIYHNDNKWKFEER